MPLKPLTHPDDIYLRAALGWLELGDHLSANEELELIRPEWRAHPDVLDLRCVIYRAANKWDYALAMAEGLTQVMPEDPRGWIHVCKTLYFTKRIQQAYDVATAKLSSFPQSWELHYDTACYACLLGKIKQAEEFLALAFELGDAKRTKLAALADPDLEALWKTIEPL